MAADFSKSTKAKLLIDFCFFYISTAKHFSPAPSRRHCSQKAFLIFLRTWKTEDFNFESNSA
jgi:hypothetical protein